MRRSLLPPRILRFALRLEPIWRRFTPMGRLIVGFAIILPMIAIDLERSIAYQALSIVLALVIIACAWAPVFRGTFGVERSLPRLATVGQTFRYRARIENRGRKIQSGLRLFDRTEWSDSMASTELASSPKVFAPKKKSRPVRMGDGLGARYGPEASVPTLVPGGSAEVDLELTPSRRGRLMLTESVISRPDPLGVFCAWVRIPLAQSVTVLPRRYEILAQELPGQLMLNSGGVNLASNVGGFEEFISLRDYKPGDSPRSIHWRSWAREGRPIVKEFADEYFARHGLILDTFMDSEDVEVFEEAVSVAASFAANLSTQESLLDLMFVGTKAYTFTAGRGLAHTEQMLEVLAGVSPTPEASFQVLSDLVLGRSALLSGIIAVLVAWDEPRKELVRQLVAIGIPVRVFVIQPASHPPKLEPGPLAERSDAFHVLEVGRIAEQLNTVGKLKTQ